ncbi:hypothetical protein J4212_08215 [Candidatus Woesearchaeota archaeon]|nr:hypothetical protein [Candidatus Woesearchaeota archaeon]
MNQEEYLKVCPQCGSTEIKIPNAGLDIGMSVRDKCVECGNIGNFPEILKEQLDEFRKELKKWA